MITQLIPCCLQKGWGPGRVMGSLVGTAPISLPQFFLFRIHCLKMPPALPPVLSDPSLYSYVPVAVPWVPWRVPVGL